MRSQYSLPTSFLLRVDEYDRVGLKLTSDNTNLYVCMAASEITYSRTQPVLFHGASTRKRGKRVRHGNGVARRKENPREWYGRSEQSE
jgi:hypothetical protein